MTTQTNQTRDSRPQGGNAPTHYAKVRHGTGDDATYEQIGVGWATPGGAVYVKLAGTQVVSEFALYPAKPRPAGEAQAERLPQD